MSMLTNETQRIRALTAAALLLALASIVTTRAFKLFTLAEFMSVAACLAGVGVLLAHRRIADGRPLSWPRRLIVAGSLIGLTGLFIKGVFVLLGIGTGEHDMAGHEPDSTQLLLQHIHHLFFNAGFVLMIVAAIGLGVSRLRKS